MKFYKAVHQVIGDTFVYDCYINPGRGPIEFPANYDIFRAFIFLSHALVSFLAVNDDHRRKRGAVFAIAEFQAATYEADFRFVVYVIVEPFCIGSRW